MKAPQGMRRIVASYCAILLPFVLVGCGGRKPDTDTLHATTFQAGDTSSYGASSALVSGEKTPGMFAKDFGPGGANVGWFAGNNDLAPHSFGFLDQTNGSLMGTIGDSTTKGDFTLYGTEAAFVAAAGACKGGHAFTNGVAIFSSKGAPSCKAPNGSLYLRADGVSGARFYVSAGDGSWSAVPGV